MKIVLLEKAKWPSRLKLEGGQCGQSQKGQGGRERRTVGKWDILCHIFFFNKNISHFGSVSYKILRQDQKEVSLEHRKEAFIS